MVLCKKREKPLFTLSQLLCFFSGIFILQMGVAIQVRTELGLGCWDSVNLGISKLFNSSISLASFTVGVTMVILAGVIRKGRFRFTTLITAFCMGFGTDICLFITSFFTIPSESWRVYPFLALGILLAGIGFALYLQSGLPPNALDDFTLALTERYPIDIGKAKLVVDISGLLIAFLLKGPIGLGTIFITLLVGPCAGVFNKVWKSILRK